MCTHIIIYYICYLLYGMSHTSSIKGVIWPKVYGHLSMTFVCLLNIPFQRKELALCTGELSFLCAQIWIGFCYWAIWIGLVFGLVLSCRPRTLFLMISWRTTEMSTDIQIFLKKRERVKKKIRRISWQASVKKSEQHVPFLMSDLLCVTNVLKIQLKWLLAWKKKKKTGSLNLFHVYFNFNYFSFPTSN